MPKKPKSTKWGGKIGPDQWLTMNEIKNFLDIIVEKTTPPGSLKDFGTLNPYEILESFRDRAIVLRSKTEKYYPEDTSRF